MAIVAGNRQSSSMWNETNVLRRDKRSSSCRRLSPRCHGTSVSAASDVAVLLVVLFACGYLTLPYLQLFYRGLKMAGASVGVRSLGVAGLLASCVACFVVVRCSADDRKCENPNCRGLRNGRVFDIKIETEDCLRRRGSGSTCTEVEDASRDGEFFELHVENHRKLEDRLKKLAPPNGRAVLIFRANCGCSAGRMEVWGPKKRRRAKR